MSACPLLRGSAPPGDSLGPGPHTRSLMRVIIMQHAGGDVLPPAVTRPVPGGAGRVILSARDRLVEFERGVQRPYGQFEVFLGNHDGNLDFRGGDHLDVDALACQGLEHFRGHASV